MGDPKFLSEEANGASSARVRVGRALGAFSATTLAGVLLYALGTAFYRAYYAHYGVDIGALDLPLYKVLYPQREVLLLLYHSVLCFIGLEATATEPLLQRKSSSKWRDFFLPPGGLQTWVSRLGAVAFLLNILIFRFNWVPILSGTGAGILLFAIRRFNQLHTQIMTSAVILTLMLFLCGHFGRVKAKATPPLKVSFALRTKPQKSEEGLLIAYDGRNYFVLDYQDIDSESARRRIRIIPDAQVAYVEYTLE